MLLVAKLGIFPIQQKLSRYRSNQFYLKGNKIFKSVSKQVARVVSSQLFIEVRMKIKYCLLAAIPFKKWLGLTSPYKNLKSNKHQKIYRAGCANSKTLEWIDCNYNSFSKWVIYTCAEATFSENFNLNIFLKKFGAPTQSLIKSCISF